MRDSAAVVAEVAALGVGKLLRSPERATTPWCQRDPFGSRTPVGFHRIEHAGGLQTAADQADEVLVGRSGRMREASREPLRVITLQYGDSRRGRRRDPETRAPVILPRSLLALLTVLVFSAPVSVGAQGDTEAERNEVQQRQAEVDRDLDVLEASNAEINAALDDLEAELTAHQAALDAAEASRVEAEAAVRQAEIDLARAERDVEVLVAAIREMAIASYVHPPTADLVRSLEAQSFSDVLLQRTYLDARAKRDVDLLELLERAEEAAAERTTELATAAEAAALAVEETEAALQRLRAEEAEQSRFAAQVRDRIDASLAEAAVLADMDAELAAKIRAEQAALIARIPPPVQVAKTGVTTSDPTPPTPAAPSLGTANPPPTTQTPTTTQPPRDQPETTTPPTTAAPAPRPPKSAAPTPSLRTVQGITVAADIAADVDALLTAARADGVNLSGWGYRSADRQVQLRMQNCGTSQYDVWTKSASACSPPTAVPGRSLHERGRAIDFTHEGRTITSRSSEAFRWLAGNAARFGLYNLPSEPWHWSTSGG